MSGRFVTMAASDDGYSSAIPVFFATAPEKDAVNGLCRAQMLHFLLARPRNASEPAVIWASSLSDVYKVTGEVDVSDSADSFQSGADAVACADAGPVLPVRMDEPSQQRFFSYQGLEGPRLAVAALQGAIRAAREGRYGAVTCTPRYVADACRNPAVEFGQLDLADLVSVELATQSSGSSENYVLTAQFVAENSDTVAGWRTLVVAFSSGPFPLRPEFRYGATEFTR